MEFLKDILGEELYGFVKLKLNEHNGANKEKEIKLINLNDGGYVSTDKYNTTQTQLIGIQEQLKAANETINTYKEMDIDGIKESAANWEKKYKVDTAALESKIATQKKEFAAASFLSSQGFKSKLAQKAALSGMMELDFKDEKFSGAEDYIKKLREEDPDSFVAAKEKLTSNPNSWVRGTGLQGTRPKPNSDNEAYLKAKYGKNKYYRGGTN